MKINYVIISVSDMKQSVSFYREVLELPLRFESPGWTEFATEGATLALHRSGGPDAEREIPRRDAAGRCRPGFRVTNLDEFHEKMLERKVPCIQEPKEVFGSRVAQYSDPDGLVLSVGEERRGP